MPSTIIDQLENIAGQLTKCTCQLFVDKDGKEEYPQPLGTAILFAQNNSHYLISCAHVLVDHESNPPYIFKSKNEISTIGGEYLSTGLTKSSSRFQDKYDFTIVKLDNETIQNFMQIGKNFLFESDILTGYRLHEKDYAMCIGYPANRTKVNVRSKMIEMKGLKYISKFLKYDLAKYGFNPDFHLVIKYSINNFINNKKKTVSKGPKPDGLSGGGVWAIITNPNKTKSIKLVGLLTEYRQEHSAVIATRIDLIIDAMKQRFDPKLQNNGIKINIL